MPVDIVIPSVGESVTSGVIAAWRKKKGDPVKLDDVVLDLETDKVTMEVRAPASGVIAKTLFNEGDTVNIGAIVAQIDDSAVPAAQPPAVPNSLGGWAPTASMIDGGPVMFVKL
ncbi:hypothetical protein J4558_13375 [Leptolyngbya sp. 15MV]|nr:hypothetical protein J4558_13375 [Leptolyngbya sp. 15MV]